MNEPDRPVVEPEGLSLWQEAWRRLRRDRLAMACLAVIVLYSLIAVGVACEIVAGPETIEREHDQHFEPPSFDHLLGTDIRGRDVFWRTVHAVKVSMLVGLVTSLIAIVIGVVLGTLAGYFGGWVDDMVVWLYTTVSSVPQLLLVLGISMVSGKGLKAIFLAIGLTSWVSLCRVIRAEVLKHKERDYVTAARALGAGDARCMFVHILPNVMHLVIIYFSLLFVFAIQVEVILSFLGLGVEEAIPSWGKMIDGAKQELFQGVWWSLAGATLAMLLIVMAFNVFGDALRDALDPKLRA